MMIRVRNYDLCGVERHELVFVDCCAGGFTFDVSFGGSYIDLASQH